MTDILPALNCLRTANAQILPNHRQIPQFLSTLETSLKTGAPFADPLMEQLQENIANGVVNENHSDNISRCERVLCIIEKRLCNIEQYAQQSAKEAVGDAPQETGDLRIIDAQICNCSEERARLPVKFRKMLAVRSLSSEFMRFQETRLHYSRVNVQVNKLLSTAGQTRDGAIKEFIKTKRHISDRRIAASMIKIGTKLLVLERLYGHCGISAILWAASSWTKLNYSDLPIFVEILSQAPKYAKIRMTVEKLDDWYEQCQAVYDRKATAQQRALSRQTNGRKRGIEKPKTSQKPRIRERPFRQNNIGLLLQGANLSRVAPFNDTTNPHNTELFGEQQKPEPSRLFERKTDTFSRDPMGIGATSVTNDPQQVVRISEDSASNASPFFQRTTGGTLQEPQLFNSDLSAFSFYPPGNISHSTGMNNPGHAVQEPGVFNSDLSAFSFPPPGNMNNLGNTVQEPEVFNSDLSAFSFFPPGNISHSTGMNNPEHAVQEPEVFNSDLSAFSFSPPGNMNNLGNTVQEPEVFNSDLSAFSFFPPGNISHSTGMNNLGRAVQEPEVFNSDLSAFSFSPPGNMNNLRNTVQEPEVFNSDLSAFSFSPPGNMNNPGHTVQEPEVFNSGLNAFSFVPSNISHSPIAKGPAIPEAEAFDSGISEFSFGLGDISNNAVTVLARDTDLNPGLSGSISHM